MIKFGQIISLVYLALALAGSSSAESGSWQDVPNGRLRLLSAAGADEATLLGLEIDLEPGWKIYWEYAGPVGQPTLIEFDGLSPDQSGYFFLTWPKRSALQGFPSYGYEGRTLFPGILSGAAGGGSIRLGLSICSETQCIPFRTSIELPSAESAPDLLARNKISRVFSSVPIPVDLRPDLDVDRLNNQIIANLPAGPAWIDLLVSAETTAARAGFFLEEPNSVAERTLNSDYEIRERAQDLNFLDGARIFAQSQSQVFVFDLRDREPYDLLAANLEIEALSRSWLLNLDSAQVSQDVALQSQQLRPPSEDMSVWVAAFFLLIGGLLLNLMPCVLPVLFLKLKAVLAPGFSEQKRNTAMRQSFAWTAAGIIGTFLILGGILSAVQLATGLQLTLGAWMQFPLTTLVLSGLVTLFIGNALGWFEFIVPSSVLNFGAERQGIVGDLIAGMVATMLGGACAGILMAVALGVAFAQGPVIMTLLLGLMGVGLAVPYLIVAFVPGAAQLVPKPGAWMSWLKPIMAAGLALTLVYLLLIATRQLEFFAVWMMSGLCILILAGLFLLSKGRSTLGSATVFVGLTLLVLVLPFFKLEPNPAETERVYADEIAELVENGERVLVDVTAFWCATCQTNKLLVLDRADMQKLFEETSVRTFIINADVFSDNIAEFVAAQGRSSLPLNVLFSPAYPDGEVLPSVLTKEAVRQAVSRTL